MQLYAILPFVARSPSPGLIEWGIFEDEDVIYGGLRPGLFESYMPCAETIAMKLSPEGKQEPFTFSLPKVLRPNIPLRMHNHIQIEDCIYLFGGDTTPELNEECEDYLPNLNLYRLRRFS